MSWLKKTAKLIVKGKFSCSRMAGWGM